jgi:hypothetical protein
VGCGEKKEAATPSPTPKPDTQVVESGGDLAIGLTEPNPAFIDPDKEVPEAFARWRDAVKAMNPVYYRLVVDWPSLEADLGAPRGGCMRDVQPCAGYNGLKDQLAAIAAAQKKSGDEHWQVLVVITGTPDALALPPSGCERAGAQPRSRTPTEAGLAGYGELISRVQAAADEAGAKLRYWSPWNEPNHPFGISPQRTRCKASAPSAAVAPYAGLARAMRKKLKPGQELVLGELAGLLQRKSGYTRIGEFIRELPKDVVCSARIFGQHGYVGGPDPVESAARALASHDCPQAHEIWITETGVGAPRRGEERKASAKALVKACRNIRKRLIAWHEDPRVTAAFQYTLREDDRFPTGLVTVDLAEAYPALKEWTAWGGDRAPSDPPPAATCAA